MANLISRVEILEWEIKSNMAKASIGSYMDDFLGLARKRWEIGIKHYRGGDGKQPFSGDPLHEAIEECVDLYAYSEEAKNQGMVSEVEADQINCHAYDAYILIRRIQKKKAEELDVIVQKAKKKKIIASPV